VKATEARLKAALDRPTGDIRLYLLFGPDEAGAMALAEMRGEVAGGADVGGVMKRHRVFFQEESATGAALRRWSPAALASALRLVRAAERATMSGSSAGNVLPAQTMIELAARRARS
jgi:DNA polymerase-3 subunit delta